MMSGMMQSMEHAHKRKKLVISIIIIALAAGAVTAGYIWWKNKPKYQAEKTFEDLMNEPVPEITAEQRAQFDALMAQPAATATSQQAADFNTLMLEGTNQ